MDEQGTTAFGDWLREKLVKSDRTASWLARRLNIKPQTVASYLNEGVRPGRDKIPMIASALGINEAVVWDAWRETPTQPFTDVTLVRLLDLPDDFRRDEAVLLRHIFRAIRAAAEEIEANDLRDSHEH